MIGKRALVALSVLLGASCERQPLAARGDDPAVPVTTSATIDSVISFEPFANWPALHTDARLGEVAGVGVDSHGHVFVFQRADRGWDTGTVAPIADATVWVLDGASGRLLAKWGAGQFRLPHGLTVDANDNIWLTDAALHQVFQFSHDGQLRLVVGEAGVAGWDAGHFNRPTDVAVRADGSFYVTDGYENQRVAQFTASGRFVREWGRSGFGTTDFRLPHAIALRGDQLLIADRENGRVAIYDTTGSFRRTLSPLPGSLVYAATFDATGALLIAIRNDVVGGVVRMNNLDQITQGMGAAPVGRGEYLAVHDLAAAADGSVYIAENRAAGLRKYTRVARPR